MGTTPGEILRETRLRRHLSLEDAANATRIRVRYIEALEDDDYSLLPAGVYARGFLRNYADYLQLPAGELLDMQARWRGRRSDVPAVQPVARPLRPSPAPRSRLFSAAGAVLLIAAVLVVIGRSGDGASSAERGEHGRGADAASGTPILVLPPLSAAPAEPTAVTSAPASGSGATAGTPTPVVVELRALELVWLRATVDGQVAFEGFMDSAQSRRWSGQQGVHLRIGNAGGVEAIVNGQRLGVLGAPRQVVEREWRRP